MSAWRESLSSQILTQQSRECSPFEGVVQDYGDLWHAFHALQQRVLASGGGPGGGGDVRTRELEQRVEQLQQDLVAKYRSEARDATAQLQVEAELRRAQQGEREKGEQLDRARAALRERSAQLEEEARTAGRAREEAALLRNELVQLRRRLERAEAQVRQLTKENSTLIDRVMSEKMTMVDEMNRMTAMYQDLSEKHTALLQQVKGGGKKPAPTAAPPPPPPANPEPPKDFLGIASGAAAALKNAAVGALTPSPITSPTAPPAAGAVPVDEVPLDTSEAWNEALPCDPLETEFQAHESETPALHHDETGRYLLTAACDGTIKVWDAGMGLFQLKTTLRVPSAAPTETNSTAFLGVDCRAGLVLGAGSDRAARLWSLETERCLHTLTGHVSKIYACALTGDGKHAVTGGTDRKIIIWDVNTGYRLRTISCGSICNALAVSDENVYIVSGHQDKGVRMWDMRDGKMAFSCTDAHEGPVCSVGFFPGAHRLLTSSRDDTLAVLDIFGSSSSSPVLKRFSHADYHAGFNWSTSRLSPGASLVAAPSNNGKVFVWRVESGALVSVLSVARERRSNPLEAVSWSPLGGGRISAVDKEGYCTYWKHRPGSTPMLPRGGGLGGAPSAVPGKSFTSLMGGGDE